MTKEEILAMEAGRELDALVAEKVMGGTRSRARTFAPEHKEYWVFSVLNQPWVSDWKPSTDISAAWKVISRFQDYGVIYTPTRGHYCFIQTTKELFQSPSCDSAPEAICKAALLAVMEG